MIFILPSDYFGDFFSSLNESFEYLYSYFQLFLSFLLSYPITYYAFFMLLFIPAFYFLVDWLQDFVSQDEYKSNFKSLNSNFLGFFRFSSRRYFGLKRKAKQDEERKMLYLQRQEENEKRRIERKEEREREMNIGRLYKTRSVVVNGTRYKYVSSRAATDNMSLHDVLNTAKDDSVSSDD